MRTRLVAPTSSCSTSTVAPTVHAVLDEGVLHRQVGSPEITRGQLTRLAELSTAPHITIQILPFSAGALSAAIGGGFVVLGLDPDPSLVYLESYEISHYIEGEPQAQEFRDAFAKLAEAALSPDESAQLLADASKVEG